MTFDQEEDPVLRLKAIDFAAGVTPVPVRKSIALGVVERVGAPAITYVTLMVFGLPATSLPAQLIVEQPRNVMVPVKVPATPGESGVIVTVPDVAPVIWKTIEKPLPDCDGRIYTVPLLTLTVTTCAAGAGLPCVALKLTVLVETE